jgi:hypothetical protein
MILRLMLLSQLLLVAVGKFLHRRLKRLHQLERIARRMVAVQIFLGEISGKAALHKGDVSEESTCLLVHDRWR